MTCIADALILLMACFSTHTIISQEQSPVIDVNGINITEIYTKQQVVAAWGEPEVYRINHTVDNKIESYYYDDTSMMFTDGVLTTISLADNRFSLFKLKEGGFKVADYINRVATLNLGELILRKEGEYWLRLTHMDDAIRILTKNNLITRIIYVETN